MMIGQLVWEKIDLIRVLKHLAAMLAPVYDPSAICNDVHSAFYCFTFKNINSVVRNAANSTLAYAYNLPMPNRSDCSAPPLIKSICLA